MSYGKIFVVNNSKLKPLYLLYNYRHKNEDGGVPAGV